MANKTEMDKAIERLRQMLEKKKGDLFVKAADGFGKGITMQPVNNDEVEDEEINGLLIKTGTVIDDMIGGGIGVGKSAMVYGAPACVPTGTWIKVPKRTYSGDVHGRVHDYILLKNLKVGDKIISVNMNTGEEEEDIIINKTKRKVYKDEPVYKIFTDEGHEIIATGNHPFLTVNGWVNAINLKVGDNLISSKYPIDSRYKQTKDFKHLGGVRGNYFKQGGSSWNKNINMSDEVKQKISESRIEYLKNNPIKSKNDARKGAISLRKKLIKTLPLSQQKLLRLLGSLYDFEMEYPVVIDDNLIIIDIANLKCKTAIFYDGEYWHKDISEKDKLYTKLLEKEGWKVIRYKDDINIDSPENMSMLKEALADPIIAKIERVNENWVYDITTKNHNFIANGLVVHNSGKSQTAFTVLALCENYVVWIDMEDTFSFKRLKEICEARNINYEEKKKKLILYRCNNWFEQMIAVRSIPSPEEIKTMYGENAKIDLIIADSLTDQFRGVEFTGRETLPLKTGMLREFLGALKDNAVAHKAGILYTNQISAKPVATPYASACDTQSPVGGYSVEHKPSFSLHFRKGSGNIRVVRIMDSSFNKLGERAFVINEKGIDNLPKQAEKAQLYEKNSEKFDSTQSQEEKIKEEKRKKKLVYKPDELTEEEVLEEINAVEESLPIEG